jgi:hypothetical protein
MLPSMKIQNIISVAKLFRHFEFSRKKFLHESLIFMENRTKNDK